MAVIQEPTTAVAETLAQPDIRTVEAIDEEIRTIQRRKAEYVNVTVSALRIAVQAEDEMYKAALVAAVRADRPAPPREFLNKAETALRHAEEHVEAFAGVYTVLATERQGAIARQLAATRAANTAERASLRVAQPALEAALRNAQRAVNENRARHQKLLDTCMAHHWAP
jgi:hypothetical protein